MAGTATKLFEYTIDRGTDRVAVREVYKIAGLPFGGADDFYSATGFPQHFAPHGKFTNAICVGHRMVKIVSQVTTPSPSVTVLAYADFRSNNPYSGGPREISEGWTVEFYERVPVWRYYYAPPGNTAQFYRTEQSVLRPAWRRVIVKFTTIEEDQIADLVAVNVGKWKLLGSMLYQFEGLRASSNGLGQTRLAYTFVTFGALPAFGISHFGETHIVPLPALPPNGRYLENIPADIGENPTIDVQTIDEFLPGHVCGPMPELP